MDYLDAAIACICSHRKLFHSMIAPHPCLSKKRNKLCQCASFKASVSA